MAVARMKMRTIFAQFISAETSDKEEYNDARMKYKKKSGLLVLSDGKRQDSMKAAFHILDENGNVSSISTSSGQIAENSDCISIKTSHSIYIFGKEFCLRDDEKAKLLNYVNQN